MVKFCLKYIDQLFYNIDDLTTFFLNGADKNNPEVSESSSSTNVCDSSVTSKDDKKFDYEKNWYELPAESK